MLIPYHQEELERLRLINALFGPGMEQFYSDSNEASSNAAPNLLECDVSWIITVMVSSTSAAPYNLVAIEDIVGEDIFFNPLNAEEARREQIARAYSRVVEQNRQADIYAEQNRIEEQPVEDDNFNYPLDRVFSTHGIRGPRGRA